MVEQGRLFDRYQPLRAFRGDCSVLYLCSDVHTRDPVALKTFLPELTDAKTARSLRVAAEQWIRIGHHPHVVTAHRIQDVDPLCLVLDFVEPAQGMNSPSLRGWLAAPMVPEAACAIALGIVRGMRHAAGQVEGLVHGDLRPENVMIGRDLRARVTDFGMSPRVDGKPPKEGRGYWAPEQWSGSAVAQSDIYAFGVILLEMLLGAHRVSTLEQGPSRHAPWTSAARKLAQNGEVPEVLRALLASCVAPTPDLRPTDWAELDRRLTTLWPSLSVRDAPEIPGELVAAREDELMRAWSSQEIANALRDRGAFQEALTAYRVVARTAARERDLALEASAVENASHMLRALGNVDAATRELLHALELRRSAGDPRNLAEVMFLLGDLYASRGDADNALASLFAAARLFAEVGDRRGVAASRLRMAPVLEAVGRTTEAREAEDESAAILADIEEG